MIEYAQQAQLRVQVPFGQWLRQRRKELGLTQEELGERISYSGETIRKIEAGRRRPSKRLARLLAKALGARQSEVGELLDGSTHS
jgi:transcriptional regulator with XRE-family HTH domain